MISHVFTVPVRRALFSVQDSVTLAGRNGIRMFRETARTISDIRGRVPNAANLAVGIVTIMGIGAVGLAHLLGILSENKATSQAATFPAAASASEAQKPLESAVR